VSAEQNTQAAELQLVRAMNAILRVAARHEDLLRRDAFEAFAAELAQHTPLGRLVVVVPDESGQTLYAASLGNSASPPPPFGARFPLPDVANRRAVMEGAPRICSDTRLGDAVDRLTASWGYLSYAALPIRDLHGDREPSPIVAKLIACFPLVQQAAEAPMELLLEAAALFGLSFRRSVSAARERRLALILETSGDALLAWDNTGKIADANAAASRLTGLPRPELMGQRIQELVQGLAGEAAPTAPKQALRTRLRTRAGYSSGDWLPVSITLGTVPDDPGVVAHLLARDVSHLVAAERDAAEYLARLRALEEQHRTLLDNVPLVIFRLDPGTGAVQYLSRHAEVLLGISPEYAGQHPDCLRAAHAEASAAQHLEEAFRRARSGLPLAAYEARLVKPSGDEISVRASLYALTESGRVVAVEGILADISSEHAARRQLVQTDRLSTLGRLAASVAHEINNPAAFLMLGLEHLGRLISEDMGAVTDAHDEASQLVAQMLESLQRIADIVRDLRFFAGPVQARVGEPSVATDVQRGIQSALTLTRSQLVERARLALDLEPVPAVLLEKGRLAQVMVNLLVNAAQAIPKDNGREHRITVSTRADEDGVQIEVSDTGVGIAAADLTRIWTPFFTTKELGTGTGLGLSISRDIVERAGGRIEVVSPAFGDREGAAFGSRFIVHLQRASDIPASQAPPSWGPRSVARALSHSPATRKRVLIVEDELVFGHALARELGERHDVRLARGGVRALELLAAEHFDVVVCDVRMPEVSGESLYTQACARHPGCRDSFIFMTGIGFGADLVRLQEVYQRPVLEKPFPMERLLQAIAQLN
jgi:PAS domain S-box-containing protein